MADRNLPTPAAARYLNMSVRRLRAAVARGEVPPPTFRGRPNLWSRAILDKVLAGESVVTHNTEDPDRMALRERINALR